LDGSVGITLLEIDIFEFEFDDHEMKISDWEEKA